MQYLSSFFFFFLYLTLFPRFPLPRSGVGLFDRSTRWSGTEGQEDETADLIVALCGPIKVLRDLLHHWKLPSIADIGDTWESRMRLCYGVKGVLKRKTQFVPFLLKLCEKEEDAQYIGRCDACIIAAPAHNHHHEDTEEGGIHNMLRIKQTITLVSIYSSTLIRFSYFLCSRIVQRVALSLSFIC